MLIGFAAETDDLVESARRKLESKNCDMVVANLVNQDGTGFEADENEVVLVLRTGRNYPARSRAQARNRRPHPRPGSETPPGAARGSMTKDEVRQRHRILSGSRRQNPSYRQAAVPAERIPDRAAYLDLSLHLSQSP